MTDVNDEAVEKLKKGMHRVWARSDANGDEFIRALALLLIEQIAFEGSGRPEESIRLAEAVVRDIMEGVNG